MEKGASTSSFPSRNSPLKKYHTTHPTRTRVIPDTILITTLKCLRRGREFLALQELGPPHGPGCLILGPHT